MKFSIDPEIFAKWPEVKLGVIVALDVDNTRGGDESVRLLRQEEEKTKALTELPLENVLPWRRAYEDFGASPKKYLSSIESLLTRVISGKALPDINPLVNFYNYTSLKYKLPFGGEDLDKVAGDIELTFAEGTEKGIYLGGEKEEVCLKGEVIYKDAEGFICRRWNWREADRTKLTKETRNLVMVAEILTDDREEELSLAVGEFAKLVEEVLGGRTKLFILDKGNPVAEVDFLTGTKTADSLITKEKNQPIKQVEVKKEVSKGVRGELADKIRKVVSNAAGVDIDRISLEHPEREEWGDYAVFMKPGPESDQVVNKLKKLEFVENVSRVGGFVNIRLKSEVLAEEMEKATLMPDVGKGKTVVVEYGSPNVAKQFGIGHLRSTVIGQALYNVYKALGYKAIGDDHLGDWGTQFGKILFMIDKEKPKELSIENLERMYVEFHKHLEWEEEGGKWFKKLEDGDIGARKVWQKCKEVSVAEFERIYRRLGVAIDNTHGESHYEAMMLEVIKEAKEKGVAVKSQGAWIIETGHTVPLMLVKSDGGTTYATRDLATIRFRMEKWRPDLIIYEVGSQQVLHFEQVFEAALRLGYVTDKNRLVHTKHGWYLGPDGKKFATREGNTVRLEGILDEAVARAAKLGNIDVAEAVGIGAVKYFDLSHNIASDIVFDWEKVMALEGNSGSYLQYTYARTQSVLTKSQFPISNFKSISNFKFNNEEMAVLRWIYRFPEVVVEAAARYAPNLICNFLYELAQRFNTFYNQHSILSADNEEKVEFRLAMTKNVGEVLKKGLELLGIEALERM